jgi:hypothetical protein
MFVPAMFKGKIALRATGMTWLDDPETDPAWKRMFEDAGEEALNESVPVIQEELADVFARDFTLSELKAGVAFVEGPSGAFLRSVLLAAAEGRPEPKATLAYQRAERRLTATRSGAGFASKFGALWHAAEFRSVFKVDGRALIIATAYRHFGEKVEAARQARLPADDPEALAPSLDFAHRLLSNSAVRGRLIELARHSGDGMAASAPRKDWPALFNEAAGEQIEQGLPEIELAAARRYARYFTPEELAAGSQFISSGVMDYMVAADRAAMTGAPKPTPSEAVKQAYAALMGAPAGRAFLDKFSRFSQTTGAKDFGPEFRGIILAGVLRRFGEKAEAAEKARRLRAAPI